VVVADDCQRFHLSTPIILESLIFGEDTQGFLHLTIFLSDSLFNFFEGLAFLQRLLAPPFVGNRNLTTRNLAIRYGTRF
jgi:hypothetical protein